MRKILTALVMLAVLLSFCACSGSAGDNEKTAGATKETQAARQEIQLNEKITVGEKAFALTEFEWKDELKVGKIWSPDTGNTFARIQVSFFNEGRKEMKLQLNCRLNYDNGYEVIKFFGENGYLSTNYPIEEELAAGHSYDLNFAAAEVTEYAKTDKSTPLWIEIDFEGQQYIYYIRK